MLQSQLRCADAASSPAISLRRGFTKFNMQDYVLWKQEGRMKNDGVNSKLLDTKGPIAARKPEDLFEEPGTRCREPVHA